MTREKKNPEPVVEIPVTGTNPVPDGRGAAVEPPLADEPRVSQEMAEKDAELAAMVDRLKRLQAEFENYRKRSAREIAALRERVADDEICTFLPPYENLERALALYAELPDGEALAAGVKKVFGQFHQILEQKGLKRICAVGERFDPDLHEALACVPSDQEKNTVLEELSPGYARGGRTLLPSKVAVSLGPAAGEKEDA